MAVPDRFRNVFRRWILGPATAVLGFVGYAVFRALPLDWASWIGGRLLRGIGPRLGRSEVARRNLRHAFPEKTADEIEAIVAAMWDNLGRSAAEYPHLATIIRTRTVIEGAETIVLLRDDGKPGIFFAGHLGNWELATYSAMVNGLPLSLVYRAPNNPLIEGLYALGRRPGSGGLIPKGSEGARRLMKLMKRGGHIGMLVDQKMNDGIPLPFFGRTAMTAPALAHLAYRFDCPVVGARVVRLGGAHFRVTIEPPLELPRTDNLAANVAETLCRVNALLEGWIREHPEQWLWVHRRWPD